MSKKRLWRDLLPAERRLLWAEALDSSEYPQCRGALRINGVGYDVLGVACNLKASAGWSPAQAPVIRVDKRGNQERLWAALAFDGESQCLSLAMCRDLQIHSRVGVFDVCKLDEDLEEEVRSYLSGYYHNGDKSCMTSLVELNDVGAPFSLASRIITASPEGMFHVVD